MASKRPDGRVEPGQRISSAFSARAWNRAQDAADVVLGARTGATAAPGTPAPQRIVFPVQVSSGTTFPYAVVQISGCPNLNTQAQSSPYTSGAPSAANAGLPSFAFGSLDSSGSIWCICEPVVPADGAAYCVFGGVTFARVRVRNASHVFAVPSKTYELGETFTRIPGVLDSTECECEGAAKIISVGGSTIGSVYWAMIQL